MNSPRRFAHAAARVTEHEVAIYGGLGGGDGRQRLGDVALLDALRLRWAVLEFGGLPPAPRAAAVGAATSRRLWIFGGAADGGAVVDAADAEGAVAKQERRRCGTMSWRGRCGNSGWRDRYSTIACGGTTARVPLWKSRGGDDSYID